METRIHTDLRSAVRERAIVLVIRDERSGTTTRLDDFETPAEREAYVAALRRTVKEGRVVREDALVVAVYPEDR